MYLLHSKIQKLTFLKVPRQCPVVLLVKVDWRQARALGIEEGYLMISVLFEYAAYKTFCTSMPNFASDSSELVIHLNIPHKQSVCALQRAM
jgi:hypothetical protein